MFVLSTDDQQRAEARDARAIKLAIGAFCAVLLLTIVTSVQLSTLDVTYGTLVFGADTVWRGHSASFRIAAYDPRGTDLVGPISARLVLRDESGERAEAKAEAGLFVETGFEVPADLGDDAMLDIEVETPAGPDRLSLALTPSDSPPPIQGSVRSHREVLDEKARPGQGPYQIALYPQAGFVVSGIENVIHAVLTRDGRPLSARIRSETLGIDTASEADGLFRFVYTPMPSPEGLALDVELGDGITQTLKLPVDARPAGLLLEVEPTRFVRPGGEATLRVRSLPFRDPIHLDIWAGGALLVAGSGYAEDGAREAVFFVPDHVTGFVRAEAYRNLAADPEGASTVLMWVSARPRAQAALEALDALAALGTSDPILDAARRASGERRALLAELALSRFAPKQRGAPMLHSTLHQRREAVSTRSTSLRSSINTLFFLTVLLGLLLIIGWIVRHQIRVGRAIRGVVNEGIAAGELETEGTNRLARVSHLYDLAMALVAVLLCLYGIYLLLNYLRWE